MALFLGDRVQQSGTANTTVSFTLSSLVTGYRSFIQAVATGSTVYYGATDGTNWETGIGTWTLGTFTLSRDTIFNSSASALSGVPTGFSGTVNVWVDYPASKAVYQDAAGVVNMPVVSVTSTTSTTPNLTFNASNSGITSGAAISGSYLQTIIQNSSATAGASVNYVLSNNLGTDSTYYGEFGMNSSVYTATTYTDYLSMNNGVYFSAHDADITVGSSNGFKTYFAWGSSGQSAHVINASGAIGLNTNLGTSQATTGTTNFGTAGQPMLSGGSGATPTWGTLGTAAGGTNLTSFTSGGAVYATSTSALTTGTLPIASGGTNSTATPTNGGVGYGTGTAYAYSAAGTAGQTLTSAGAASPVWVTKPVVQVATTGTAATYTIPTGCSIVKVTAIGPGGNGGASATGRATGGSGGGVAIKWLTGVTAGNTLTYTVGTASGTATAVSSGTQTITTISAGSGTNGASTAYAASTTAGAAGGAATGGDINLAGQASQASQGTSTTITTNWSSNGGGAPGWGIGGVASVQVATAGQAGSGWGGGGSGALGSATVGSGSTGAIIFEAF